MLNLWVDSSWLPWLSITSRSTWAIMKSALVIFIGWNGYSLPLELEIASTSCTYPPLASNSCMAPLNCFILSSFSCSLDSSSATVRRWAYPASSWGIQLACLLPWGWYCFLALLPWWCLCCRFQAHRTLSVRRSKNYLVEFIIFSFEIFLNLIILLLADLKRSESLTVQFCLYLPELF